jgi:hypothetical protein
MVNRESIDGITQRIENEEYAYVSVSTGLMETISAYFRRAVIGEVFVFQNPEVATRNYFITAERETLKMMEKNLRDVVGDDRISIVDSYLWSYIEKYLESKGIQPEDLKAKDS